MGWYKYRTSKWEPNWSYVEGPPPKVMEKMYGSSINHKNETDNGFTNFAYETDLIINDDGGYYLQWEYVSTKLPVKVKKQKLDVLSKQINELKEQYKRLTEV